MPILSQVVLPSVGLDEVGGGDQKDTTRNAPHCVHISGVIDPSRPGPMPIAPLYRPTAVGSFSTSCRRNDKGCGISMLSAIRYADEADCGGGHSRIEGCLRTN